MAADEEKGPVGDTPAPAESVFALDAEPALTARPHPAKASAKTWPPTIAITPAPQVSQISGRAGKSELRRPESLDGGGPRRAAAGTTRMLEHAPGGETNYQRRVNIDSSISTDQLSRAGPKPYLVIGLFDGYDSRPNEWVIRIKHPSLLMWQIWWRVVRLRGLSYVFSLKDVKMFRLYKFYASNLPDIQHDWQTGEDEHLALSKLDAETLLSFYRAYSSWSLAKARGWDKWADTNLNSRQLMGGRCRPSRAVALEIVLGWSPVRISVVVLVPLLLSMAVGFWYQSRDPPDPTTIQTAWTVASYIATAGGLFGGLLAILSSIRD